MKKRKLTATLLTAAVAASMLVTPAFADARKFVNNDYQNLDANGTLTLTKDHGYGTMYSYGYHSEYEQYEKGFRNKIRRVVIRDDSGITQIEYGAFWRCENLSSVYIPNSVTEIRESAFANTALTEVTIPGSVKKLGPTSDDETEGIFSETPLKKVVIESGVPYIDREMFRDCPNLTDVRLPNTIKYIGIDAFAGCGFSHIDIPNSVTEIKTSAFNGCFNLESIVIPDSVTKLGKNVFNYCPKLKSITLPATLTSVNKNLFYGIGINEKSLNGVAATPANVKINYKGTAEQWEALGVKLPAGTSVNTTTGVVKSTAESSKSSTSSASSSTTKKKKTYVTKIKISGKSSLTSGRKTRLKAKVYLKSGASSKYKKVTWSIRKKDKKYASISKSGTLKAKSVSKTHTIKVYAKAKDGSGIKAVKKIKICPAYVKKIKITGKSSVKAGKKLKLKAKVYVRKGTSRKYRKVTLSNRSKDKKYASISQSGTLKAKKKGKGHTIKVYAKAKDGSGKKTAKNIRIK